MELSQKGLADPQKVAKDLDYLLDCFQEVLGNSQEAELLAKLRKGNAIEDGLVEPKVRVAQTLSVYFALLNMVEENAVAQARRKAEDSSPLLDEGSWRSLFNDAIAGGFTPSDILQSMAQGEMEIVLTAHPTEAKRASVLEKHRELYLMLVQRENSMFSSSERKVLRQNVVEVLERIWRTGEILPGKPDIETELRNILHYLTKVFPVVLPLMDQRLRLAWESVGLPTELLDEPASLPRITLGNWVGGDRDGHPFVTHDTTLHTLQTLRSHAITLWQQRLTDLWGRLSIADSMTVPTVALLERLRVLNPSLLSSRGETWRSYVMALQQRLPNYESPIHLRNDLQLLHDSLTNAGAPRLARSEVFPLLRLCDMIGLHLACLDVRQNSRFHDLALGQLFASAGIANGFQDWEPKRKLELLLNVLGTNRPLSLSPEKVGPEAAAVVQSLRVLAQEYQARGAHAIGSLIISMTRGPEDLFVLLLLAREAGLWQDSPDGPWIPIPIVPLLETIEDLQEGPHILSAWLSHAFVMRSLRMQAVLGSKKQIEQQVMVGYSDSNKDGGVVASLWNLHRSQQQLIDVATTYGVRLKFFHGRGGTISRGAGPIGRFMHFVPKDSLPSGFRMTEQGETIAQKYANRITAAWHFELMLAAKTRATLLGKDSGQFIPYWERLDTMSACSKNVYRDIVDAPGFVEFFRQATPIDILENARIGSRPSRRTGQATISDLRAIPWNFSWGQSRFFLSGWYGFGSGIAGMEKEYIGSRDLLREHLWDWGPLSYQVGNVSTALLLCDRVQMERYASLVEDRGLADRMLHSVFSEYDKTRKELEFLLGSSLEKAKPGVVDIINRRRDGLGLLHERQTKLLRVWRDRGRPIDHPLLEEQLLVVNAIAAGLGSTG